MGKFIIDDKDLIELIKDDEPVKLIKKPAFNAFNESTLGLGDLSKESSPVNTLAVIFDLSGFTNFCKQIDPHLVVPQFLNRFLKWIYEQIRKETISQTYPEGYNTWSKLPFFSKFLGDGLLLLWDTKDTPGDEICNIVIMLKDICTSYESSFLKGISNKYSEPPNKLRCGIARGIVYSVGESNDFIGACINVASRLQKFGNLSFCFAKRGIDYEEEMLDNVHPMFLTKKINIRGIGNNELVVVSKKEFEALGPDDQKLFSNP